VFPGVSTSLGISELAACAPNDEVRVEAAVLRAGAPLAFTECRLYRPDNTLMARGWHVKYVSAPAVFRALLALRPPLAAMLLRRLLTGPRRTVRLAGRTLRIGEPTVYKAPVCEFDAATEQRTRLPRNAAGERTYAASLGRPGRAMAGWDAPLAGALSRQGGDATTWRMEVGKGHANTLGWLHGGCTASLVEALGTAAVARAAVALGEGRTCGATLSLDVQCARRLEHTRTALA